MTTLPRLVLASASPRRAELLRLAGLEFDVVVSDADETMHPDETAVTYVCRVAEAKADLVGARYPDRLVLAADTTVVADGVMLGKPRDAAEARAMLTRLSGRTHEVMTGLCLRGATRRSAVEVTTVEFAPLSAGEIEWYVASGEPFDKAGAYAIQGLASRFVLRIEGSYANVVGLPVATLYRMLHPGGA